MDVFISYANEDRARARLVADALEARGLSVWWDRKIIAGDPYDEVIEQHLETARCVVVLWSDHSTDSEWVKNEATVATKRGVLVPAMIDRVELPLEFLRRQTADLVGWDGDVAHEGFQALCDGVAAKIPKSDQPAPRPRPDAALRPRPDVAPRPRTDARKPPVIPARVWKLAATAIVVVALAFGLQSVLKSRARPPGPAPRGGPADLIAGTYHGEVTSDARGSSQSDVAVTIAKINPRRVRVTSDYRRLGTVEVDLTRADDSIQSVSGKASLSVDLRAHPPRLSYNPDGEIAYSGQKQ